MNLSALSLCLFSLLVFQGRANAQEILNERQLMPGRTLSGQTGFAGRYVALSDKWAFVVAPLDDDPTIGTGSVTIYERTSDGLAYHSKIFPPGTTTTRNLGDGRINICGRTLAIGSSRNTVDSSTSTILGRVYVYRYDGQAWNLEADLEEPDGKSFASSTALYGEDELLVGVSQESGLGPNSPPYPGAVRVYRRDQSGAWGLAQVLRGSEDPASYLLAFGAGLRIAGDSAVSIVLTTSLNAIEILRDASGLWSLGERFSIPLSGGGVQIHGLAYNGEWLAVGDTQRQCDAFSGRPKVTMMRKGPGGWIFETNLVSNFGYVGPLGNCQFANDRYGYDIAMDGARMVVGSPSAPGTLPWNVTLGVGSAVVFELVSGSWEETSLLKLRREIAWEGLGRSVAIAGDSVLVGAEGWAPGPAGGNPAGAGVFFDLPRGTQICPGVPNATGSAASLRLRGHRLAHFEDVYLEATNLPPGAFCLGLVSPQSGFTPSPVGSRGNLCLDGSIGRFMGQVGAATSAGEYSWNLEPSGVPQPTGFVPLQTGSTWYFQTWYRDSINGVATSNFSGALSGDFF